MKKYSSAVLIYCLFILTACSQKNLSNEKSTSPKNLKIGEAIQIDSGKFLGPCEPTICISKTNPNQIVGGAILDRIYTSGDGGQSWKKEKLTSPYGVYGDPVVRSDFKGNFYYAHLSDPKGKPFASEEFLDRIVIQKSEDNGQTWNGGSYTLPRSPKDQDKHWLAIDPIDNTVYITWTEFDLYGSKESSDKSRILFSKSIDEGDSWTEPITLSQLEGDCIDSDQTTEGAVPSIGPQGEIYVAWSYDEKIYFDRSLDKGVTWLQEDIVVADQPEGWDIEIPGLMRCNGMPITGVDNSGGPYQGNIYVNWGDQRNGVDDTDIWLCTSSDGGNNWNDPVRVNNDLPGKHQFLSWMDIDQTTGAIYIVFYDRRDHDDLTTDVYLARSTDGGKTFQNFKINSTAFKPNPNVFFGDYNDISAHEGRIRPIWTQLDRFNLSVWTCLVDEVN